MEPLRDDRQRQVLVGGDHLRIGADAALRAVEAGHHRVAARYAARHVAHRLAVADPLRRERVQVRRPDRRIRAAQRIPSVLIGHEKDDVRTLGIRHGSPPVSRDPVIQRTISSSERPPCSILRCSGLPKRLVKPGHPAGGKPVAGVADAELRRSGQRQRGVQSSGAPDERDEGVLHPLPVVFGSESVDIDDGGRRDPCHGSGKQAPDAGGLEAQEVDRVRAGGVPQVRERRQDVLDALHGDGPVVRLEESALLLPVHELGPAAAAGSCEAVHDQHPPAALDELADQRGAGVPLNIDESLCTVAVDQQGGARWRRAGRRGLHRRYLVADPVP